MFSPSWTRPAAPASWPTCPRVRRWSPPRGRCRPACSRTGYCASPERALPWPDEDEDESPARPVRRLGESLAEVAGHLHLDDPVVTAGVFAGWADLVGAAVAAHARPRVLRQGVLTVEVDSPAWAT